MALDPNLFRSIVERMGEPVYVRDVERVIHYVNPACERLMGLSALDMVGKRCHEIFAGDDGMCSQQCPITGCREKGCPELRFERDLTVADGKRKRVRATVSSLEDDLKLLGFVVLLQDLTPFQQAAEALELAKRDFQNQLEERTAALTRINEMLNWENEERQRVEESLVQAKEEAERASAAKSEFLSCMSHELRTPMNAILGFSQLLESEADEPLSPNQQECVTEILEAGRHLLELIEQILDLTRIDSGRLQLRMEDVQMASVLDEVEALIDPVAVSREIRIQRESSPDFLRTVRGDPVRLKQILSQLLANAIEFNNHRGTVTVSAVAMPNHRLRIGVRDTGPGIAPEHQKLVFEPFTKSLAEDFVGSGIGLVIAKRLIELMNGEIGFESRLGAGCFFWIEVPLADAGSDAEKPSFEVESSPVHAKKSVLCVEDNPANLNLIRHLLRRMGNIELLTAANGYLAVELARAHLPDLILMDIQLPGLNGYDAVRRIRAIPETAKIPVVAISVLVRPGEIQAGKEAGFDDYLPKPIDVLRFREIVSRMLGLRTPTS